MAFYQDYANVISSQKHESAGKPISMSIETHINEISKQYDHSSQSKNIQIHLV